jgi:hypothetical protein
LLAARLAPGRYGWLAASVAVIAATPRLDYYDLTYVVVGQNGSPVADEYRARPVP